MALWGAGPHFSPGQTGLLAFAWYRVGEARGEKKGNCVIPAKLNSHKNVLEEEKAKLAP